MSRVITFSRTFPSHHPRKGQPTYFVEKLYNSLYQNEGDWSSALGDTSSYVIELNTDLCMEKFKHHTIRAGHRWKVGDKFSPRVWSGKPYNSKQIIIAPDIEIKKVWDFKITTERNSEMRDDFSNFCYINNALVMNTEYEALAKNDGLTVQDMCDWFKIKFEEGYKNTSFDGQVLCWNENINY